MTQLIILLELLLPGTTSQFDFPTPFTTQFTVAGILVRGEHILVFAVVPLVTMGLAWFLAQHPLRPGDPRVGGEPRCRGPRGGESPPDVNLGVDDRRCLRGVDRSARRPVPDRRGHRRRPRLRCRAPAAALAAALIGGMVSLPLALLGGVAIGIVEAVLYTNVINTPSLISMVLFVLVLVLVLVRGRAASRDDADEAPWSFSPRSRPIPEALRDVWWVRHMSRVAGVIALVVLVALPLVITLASSQFLYSRVLLFALVALSLTVLTGWAGQLSLGQFGFVGLGAFTTAALHTAGIPFGFGILVGGVVGVVAAVVIGLPALRVKGLFLAVTTLTFAIATQQWLLSRSLFLGGTTVAILPRAHLGPIDLRDQRTYYYLCLAALVIAIAVVTRLRNSGIGRSVIATRDNERSAAAFTVAPARAKLTAFAISGAICGLAGGLFAGLFVQFGVTSFPVETSISVVTIAVIGGLGSVIGPVLGALWVIGLPAAFGDDPNIALLTSGIGLLFLLMYFPGGLIGIVYLVRDQLLSLAARGRPTPEREGRRTRPARATDRGTAVGAAPRPRARRRRGARAARRAPLRAVRRHRGSRRREHRARRRRGGRTDRGERRRQVDAHERDQRLRPEPGPDRPARPRHLPAVVGAPRPAGLGRTFQQAHLFPDLTVRETVATALEAHERTSLTTHRARTPRATADASARSWPRPTSSSTSSDSGATPTRSSVELSTGTRRIAELACLLAPRRARCSASTNPPPASPNAKPKPSAPCCSGSAPSSTRRCSSSSTTCRSSSRSATASTASRPAKSSRPARPVEVRDNPLVIASYLGTDERAIRRSDITIGDQT